MTLVQITWIATGFFAGALLGWFVFKCFKLRLIGCISTLIFGAIGAWSAFVSRREWLYLDNYENMTLAIPMLLGLIFGAIGLSGSIMVLVKLLFWPKGKPLRWPVQKTFNTIVLVTLIVLSYIGLGRCHCESGWIERIAAVAFLPGILLTLAAGGSDLPFVLALFGFASGAAAALTGHTIQNPYILYSGAGLAGMSLSLSFRLGQAGGWKGLGILTGRR